MIEPELSPKIIKLIEQYKLEVKSCPDCKLIRKLFDDLGGKTCAYHAPEYSIRIEFPL